MAYYVIADTHFGHDNIILYCERPFKSVDEMNKTMITNWNFTVLNSTDVVFHLGDVGLTNKDELTNIISRLNGRLYLIKGNHDSKHSNQWFRDVGFKEVYEYPILFEDMFIMSHDPVFMNNHMPFRNIHGHIHNNRMEDRKLYFNACVECNKYAPVSISDIIRYFHGEVDENQ